MQHWLLLRWDIIKIRAGNNIMLRCSFHFYIAVLREERQIWKDVGRCGQMRTGVDRFGQVWTDVERYGQVWTDVGRCG